MTPSNSTAERKAAKHEVADAPRSPLEKNQHIAKLDRLFRINPVKVRAKDGSGDMITIEHRIGKEGGSFTVSDLLSRMGFEKEYLDMVMDLEKKFRDRRKFEQLSNQIYSGQKEKVRKVIGGYKRFLIQFYGNYPRPLYPMFATVPISEKADALYIQGLRDLETFKLVVGDVADATMWSEIMFVKSKKFADLNREAIKTAKALLTLPGVNKDIQHRLQSIAQGNAPERLAYGG